MKIVDFVLFCYKIFNGAVTIPLGLGIENSLNTNVVMKMQAAEVKETQVIPVVYIGVSDLHSVYSAEYQLPTSYMTFQLWQFCTNELLYFCLSH